MRWNLSYFRSTERSHATCALHFPGIMLQVRLYHTYLLLAVAVHWTLVCSLSFPCPQLLSESSLWLSFYNNLSWQAQLSSVRPSRILFFDNTASIFVQHCAVSIALPLLSLVCGQSFRRRPASPRRKHSLDFRMPSSFLTWSRSRHLSCDLDSVVTWAPP